MRTSLGGSQRGSQRGRTWTNAHERRIVRIVELTTISGHQRTPTNTSGVHGMEEVRGSIPLSSTPKSLKLYRRSGCSLELETHGELNVLASTFVAELGSAFPTPTAGIWPERLIRARAGGGTSLASRWWALPKVLDEEKPGVRPQISLFKRWFEHGQKPSNFSAENATGPRALRPTSTNGDSHYNSPRSSSHAVRRHRRSGPLPSDLHDHQAART